MTSSAPPDNATLGVHGFARFGPKDIYPGLNPADLVSLLAPMRRYFGGLPPDPYDHTGNRHRRYGSAVFLPWSQTLSLVPGSPDPVLGSVFDFGQGSHNPDYRGTERRFPYIESAVLDDPLLRRLVQFDWSQVPWAARFDRNPVHVGLHLVELSVPGARSETSSSPDCFHQDGGAYATYFVHLLRRENVVGGVNAIALPRCAGLRASEVPDDAVHVRFTLHEPLESYAVEDQMVSHYVSPVRRGEGPGPGARAAILIGLLPFVQHS